MAGSSMRSVLQDRAMMLAREANRRYREWQLAPGERGWGSPREPALLMAASGSFSVSAAVIGVGVQGQAQIRALNELPGVGVVAIADVDESRLAEAQDLASLDEMSCYSSYKELLSCADVYLVSVATTAPYHLDIAAEAVSCGTPVIVVEKPLDISLSKAKEFVRMVENSSSVVAINYSRRWSRDFRAVRRAVDKGLIGEVRSVSVMVGAGELAMVASHYFDLVNFLFAPSMPIRCWSSLDQSSSTNRRGIQYNDPFGWSVFEYSRGERATFDFSADLARKGAEILIRGTEGVLTVDEPNARWSISRDGQLSWEMPFSESGGVAARFSRVAASLLNDGKSGAFCTVDDALVDLEMILASHLSSAELGAPISIPLTIGEVPEMWFP